MWRTSATFPAGNGYLAVKGGERRRDIASGGRGRGGLEASREENLDFSPVGVGHACFSLAPEPPTAPQRAGFGL